MNLRPIVRPFAASAVLALVLVASLMGAVCEARCMQTSVGHTCCPMVGQSGVTLTSVSGCHHVVSVLPANQVAPAGPIGGLAGFAPGAAAIHRAALGIPSAFVTASPPKFHLRI